MLFLALTMTTAEIPAEQHLTLAQEIAVIDIARQTRRLELADLGRHPREVEHTLIQEFAPQIARLAMRNGINTEIENLLQSIEHNSNPQESTVSKWAKRQG